MLVTILCGFIMMSGLFLMLLAGVGYIQNKKFFGSAPKEVRDAVPETKPERFRGQHTWGWIMAAVSVTIMIAAPVIGAVNGVQNDFSFGQFFIRFYVIWLMTKAFDIVFFDWVLLCNAGFNFFPHFYPETGPVLGHYLFGYNWKTHASHIILGVVVSAVAAYICTLF